MLYLQQTLEKLEQRKGSIKKNKIIIWTVIGVIIILVIIMIYHLLSNKSQIDNNQNNIDQSIKIDELSEKIFAIKQYHYLLTTDNINIEGDAYVRDNKIREVIESVEDNESIFSDVEYIFDYDNNNITQNIYLDNQIKNRNVVSLNQDEQVKYFDTTKILQFFIKCMMNQGINMNVDINHEITLNIGNSDASLLKLYLIYPMLGNNVLEAYASLKCQLTINLENKTIDEIRIIGNNNELDMKLSEFE